MKILNLSVYTWEGGGSTHVIHDNTKIQLSRGHNVDILCPYNEGDEFYPVPKGARLIPIKANWLSRFYPDFSMKAWQYITKNLRCYDLVHVHGLWNFPGLLALMLSAPSVIKVVTIHGTVGEGAMKKGRLKKKIFWNLIQKRALKKADYIQVHNETERKDLQKLFGEYQHKNISLITNGLDFNLFNVLPERGLFRKKIGIGDDKKILLFLGRLTFKKGLDILMPAFNDLAKDYQNLVLLLIGPDYGMLEYINSYIDQHNLKDRVVIYGTIKGEEKLMALVDSDIFTLPTYSESFSIATLEACAAGLPVVVSSEIGFSYEIENSDIGQLIELNPKSLSDGIRVLLDNEQRRINCGSNGRNMVASKYDLKIVTTQLIELMESLVLNRKSFLN